MASQADGQRHTDPRRPVGYKDEKFQHHADPEPLTYEQLLEKLQQEFEE